MSGTYNRKLYDRCDLLEQDRISKSVGNYHLSHDPHPHKACLLPTGIMQTKDNIFNPHRKSHIGTMIDLESHLMNLDESDDRCGDKTIAQKNKRANAIYGKKSEPNSQMCNNDLRANYSRMENPAQDIRSMTFDRFDFPVTDPQAEVFFGFAGTNTVGDMRFGLDTRLDARDSDPNEYIKKINSGKSMC